MRQLILNVLTAAIFLSACTYPKTGSQSQPAGQVLARFIGPKASGITFRTIPDDPQNPGKMVFEIFAHNGKVEVSGNSGVAQCRGAYEYLKETCNVMISWGGQHIQLPAKWPDLSRRRVICPFQFTLQDNICVFGYTTAYFNDEDWIRYLDIMALHGYNMMQAPVGAEAIWKKVWTRYGFSAKELEEYFTGPAFFPWHRMGNVNKHSGPVPAAFFPESVELQKKILKHMRELGITPIAPAFAGFVPKEFASRFPDTEVRNIDGWAGFKGDYATHILHPLSPYYQKIGNDFIEEWKHEFGEAGYFMADAFNELQPPVSRGSEEVIRQELSEFGSAIYSSIRSADPDAKWVMMAWLFMDTKFWSSGRAKALLSKVPEDKMLILDLYAESSPFWSKLDNFFGKPWMFSIIPNWGGVSQIGGLLTGYGTIIPEISGRKDVGALQAFGYSPEGTENNEAIYELVSDAMWSDQAIDFNKWITGYCTCRYGSESRKLNEAWHLLSQSVYSRETGHPLNKIQSNPQNLSIPYQTVPMTDKNVSRALDLFLQEAGRFRSDELFMNDLIELAVYKYTAIADSILNDVRKGIGRKPFSESDRQMNQLSALVNKIDLLLSGHTLFRLDRWVEKARRWGHTGEESDYYEADSKRIVTVWGADLSEYSARLWSGLLSDYYLVRWEKWYEAIKKGREFDSRSWELKWVETPQNYSKVRNDNSVEIIKELEDIGK